MGKISMEHFWSKKILERENFPVSRQIRKKFYAVLFGQKKVPENFENALRTRLRRVLSVFLKRRVKNDRVELFTCRTTSNILKPISRPYFYCTSMTTQVFYVFLNVSSFGSFSSHVKSNSKNANFTEMTTKVLFET